jgi:hypothetical protein
MIFNEPNSLSVNPVFKNSDKSGGLPLACYSVNTSKKEKCARCEQCGTWKKQKTIRCYEGVTLKNGHSDEPYQSSMISNKKQSP